MAVMVGWQQHAAETVAPVNDDAGQSVAKKLTAAGARGNGARCGVALALTEAALRTITHPV